MASQAEAVSKLRKWRRHAKLVAYRTTTPNAGDDFLVTRETNGIEISELKFTFKIDRDLSKHPNQCDIEIYNLSPRARAALEKLPLTVELSAGHDGVNRLLIVADVIHAYSKQEGADRITVMQVGDGARAYSGARMNRSFKSGTSIKTVLREAARSAGQKLPSNVENNRELDEQLSVGMSMSGWTRDEIERVLAPYGYTWSFQNGRLQVLKDTDARSDIFILDESTGMLESPKFKDPPKSGKIPNLEIKSLLYPELVPGGRVEVRGQDIKGICKIVKVKHSGDTEGDDWFTDLELQPMSR